MLIALQWASLEVSFTEGGEGGDQKFKTVVHLFTDNSTIWKLQFLLMGDKYINTSIHQYINKSINQ